MRNTFYSRELALQKITFWILCILCSHCATSRLAWYVGALGKKENRSYYAMPQKGLQIYARPNRNSKVIGRLKQTEKIFVLFDTQIPVAQQSPKRNWAEIRYRKKKAFVMFKDLSLIPVLPDYQYSLESGKVKGLSYQITSNEDEYRGIRLLKVWKNGRLRCQKRLYDFLQSHWKTPYVLAYHQGYGDAEYSEHAWGELDIRTCKKKNHSFSVTSVQTFFFGDEEIYLESYENEVEERDTLQYYRNGETIILGEDRKIDVMNLPGKGIAFKIHGKTYRFANGKLQPDKGLHKPLGKIVID